MAITPTLIRRTPNSLVYSVYHTGANETIFIENAALIADSAGGPLRALLETPVLDGTAVERLFGEDHATNGAYFDNPNISYIEITILVVSSSGDGEVWESLGERDAGIDRTRLKIRQNVSIGGGHSFADIRLQARHSINR